MRRFVGVLILIGVCVAGVSAQLTRTYRYSRLLDADNSFYMYWEPDSTTAPTKIKIGLKGNIGGYISLGWGSTTMRNLDLYMCYVDSAGTPYSGDFFVNGHSQPGLDPDQTYDDIAVSRVGATLYCEFDRPFDNNAEPAYDKVISNNGGNTTTVWAVHRTIIPSGLLSWGSTHDVFSSRGFNVIYCPGCSGNVQAPVPGAAPKASPPPSTPVPPTPKPGAPVAPPVAASPTGATPVTVTGVPKYLYNPTSQNKWDGITIGPKQTLVKADKLSLNDKGDVLQPVPDGASELTALFQYSLVLSNSTDSPFYLFWNISSDRQSILCAMQTTMSGAQSRWFGLMFGGYDRAHMRGDVVFATNFTVQDRMSYIEDEPVLDSKQSLQAASFTAYSYHGANWQTAIFGRTLAANDKDDRPIYLDKTNMVAWAIGAGYNDKHGSSSVGAVWINFATGYGRQYDLAVDEYVPNVWKGVFIFVYIVLIYVAHKTIFTARTLHQWHFEYFWLHYFKFSVFDILLFLSWIAAVIAFTVIFMDLRKDIGIVFAVGSEMPAALIFLAAIRIQFWDVIFDISYERQIRYHRWIAWTLFYLLTAHSFYVFGTWVIRGSLFDEFKIQEIVFGAVAGIQLLIIAVTALRLFRRRFWELFKWLHFTFMAFVLWGALHEIKFFWFLLPGVCVWALDRLRRFYYWFGKPADIISVQFNNDVTEIKFKKANWSYRAVVSVHAKAMGNFTEVLKQAADKTKVRILVEGPYGYKPDWRSFDVVVLFGAGIGATPWISICRDFLHDSDAKGPKHLYFHFSVTNKANLSWFDDTWALVNSSQNSALHVQKYITREKGDNRGDTTYGRPNFMEIIREVVNEHSSTVKHALIMSCGPGVFSRGVQDAAFAHSHRDRVIFEYHDEVFKF